MVGTVLCATTEAGHNPSFVNTHEYAMPDSLSRMLQPQSIAIVGASRDVDKLGGRPLYILQQTGFSGVLFPVNPSHTEIGGLVCYPSVAAIPQFVDLAILVVPGAAAAKTIRAFGVNKVGAIVMFSSGFSEVGEEGAVLEAELNLAAREIGARLLGPNCVGFINAQDKVAVSFARFAMDPIDAGPVAFITQSGALGMVVARKARALRVDLGYFVATGNESDTTLPEMLAKMLADPRITTAGAIMEGFKSGPEFLATATFALERGKPIVVAKIGRTAGGAKAAMSHTGSLAGEDEVVSGVFRQHGIVRAATDNQLVEYCSYFSHAPLPAGNRLAILTRSGGAGIVMADRAQDAGLCLAQAGENTIASLRKIMPTYGSTGNPIDLTSAASFSDTLMWDALDLLLLDDAVDVAVVWLGFYDASMAEEVARFARVRARHTKPFVVVWSNGSERGMGAMHDAGVAAMVDNEQAIDAIGAAVRYRQAREHWFADVDARAQVSAAVATLATRLALPASGGAVDTVTAVELLRLSAIGVAPVALAKSVDEASAHAAAFTYPVALKIESPDILHKTEVQGVELNLRDKAAVDVAYHRILERAQHFAPKADISGVVVQPMQMPGLEMVVGIKQDVTFGPVIMVGLGGIHVEIHRDVAFRKTPVTRAEAGKMLLELKGYPLLCGFRGAKPVDLEKLCEFISAVSIFAAASANRIEELDLNPVFVNEHGTVAVDILMLLSADRNASGH